MKRPVNEIPSEVIPIQKIWTSTSATGKASKKEEKEIETLITDIKTNGQLYPIVVVRRPLEPKSDFAFDLTAGNKRLEAARSLKWKEIKAIIIPYPDGHDDQAEEIIRRFTTIIEKLQSKSMSDYDLAEAAVEMKNKYEIKGAEFAQVLGLSQGYTYNLTRWYTTTHPDILAAWRENHPLINQSELERMSHMPKHEALAYFNKRITMRSAPDPFQPGKKLKSNNGSSTNGEKRNRRASEIQLMKLQDAINESNLNEAVKGLCRNIIKFALGASKDVPGITNYHKLPKVVLSKKSTRANKTVRETASAA